MSESKSANSGGLWKKWGEYIPVLSLVVAILAFLLGGGWAYNQWRKPNLTYQVLPTYELTDQAFSGVIISNSGRSAVTDLELIIADLEAEIIQMETPGSHEPAEVVSGGALGSTELRLHMDRLSAETSLSVYLLTKGKVNIDDSILVTSAEMKGKPGGTASDPHDWISLLVVIFSLGVMSTAVILVGGMGKRWQKLAQDQLFKNVDWEKVEDQLLKKND